MIPSSSINADVIVIGGGMIGASFASLLGHAGINTVLLEARDKPGHDSKAIDRRAFAVNLAAKKILTQLGAWQQLASGDIACFRKIQVWDEKELGSINFDSAAIGQATLGYIIPHAVITAAIHQQLSSLSTVKCYWSSTIAAINKTKNGVSVSTQNQQLFNARLVVAADGHNSTLRSLANIGYKQYDYKQHALACVVTTTRPHAEIARQRFLNTGPLAFLPMPAPYQSAVVWSSATEHINQLYAADKHTFHIKLANSFSKALGEIVESSPRVIFPLTCAHAEQYIMPRIALIGDSAHTVHPLAGLGANLGLLDAAALAQLVIESRQRHQDPGSLKTLRRYQRWRKGQNQRVIWLIDSIKYLFENQRPAIQWLRSRGLATLNKLPAVKQIILNQATGLTGDLPKIARSNHPL